ncbi:hypothetical protein BH09MYX1_BH09MYX1_32760 [soil metagenome]
MLELTRHVAPSFLALTMALGCERRDEVAASDPASDCDAYATAYERCLGAAGAESAQTLRSSLHAALALDSGSRDVIGQRWRTERMRLACGSMKDGGE